VSCICVLDVSCICVLDVSCICVLDVSCICVLDVSCICVLDVSCICVLGVSILPLSMIVLLDFRTCPKVWYCLFVLFSFSLYYLILTTTLDNTMGITHRAGYFS
jgi:hypothetical protein